MMSVLRRVVRAGVVLALMVAGTCSMKAGWAQGGVARGQASAAAGQSVSQKIAASKELLDLNTATPEQLKALPGIGDAYTQRIIAGRPYTAKNQLTTRGIIPQATYDKIKDQIIAHRPK